MTKSRQVKKYSEEFKQRAVTLALNSPTIAQVALELGMPVGTLHTWVEKLKGKTSSSTSASKNNQPDMATLLEQNRRLNKELARVTEEREILKKAAAYFAQHQR